MSVVDEIRIRLDIVDVVSGYVTLQKAGRNFKALCPFHAEKTPSFIVNPERQTWRCFGACATGGDAFSFVMQTEKLGFGEALRLLAQKTGVELSERREGDRTDILHRLNREASDFYQQVLASPGGQKARDYLSERGIDRETASAFELGLSPREGDRLRDHLLGLGFDSGQAVEAGLLRRGEVGAVRDFFWGRLMFPIHDRDGRIAGFGGRSLDGSEPKYINTPATPVFDKQSILYALHKATPAIQEQGLAVIVEGYMDAITAHQHGFTDVVASMGTALTERQIARLRSVTQEFVQALDPDAAGQEATRRSLESSYRVLARQLGQRAQLNLRIASLPVGRDPDKLIREDSTEWERLVREAVPFMEFALPAFARKYDLETAHGKAQAAEELLPLVTATTNAFEQEQYFDVLAGVLGASRETLEASIGKPAARARRDSPTGRSSTRAASLSPLSEERRDNLEDFILSLLLSRPELKQQVQDLPPEQFGEAESREIFTRWLSCSTIDELWDGLDVGLHEHLEFLSGMDLAPTDTASSENALSQSLRRLEQRHLQELQEGLLSSGDSALPPPRELEGAITNVNTRLKELFSQRDKL